MKTKELKIVNVPICELKPADYNPRKWSKKAISDLKESIKRYDIVDPILCNSNPSRFNVILGGHFRVRVAKELGYVEVPVVYIDIADIEAEKELNLRLNKNSGEFDFEMLKNFSADLLLDVGFSSAELASIFDGLSDFKIEHDIHAQDEKVPARCKPGELYQLGRHRLYCADSTVSKNVTKLMDGKLADMIYSDMPYNIGLDYDKGFGSKSKYGGHTNDSKSEGEYSEFVRNTITSGVEHSKNDAHVFWYTDENYVWLVQTTYKKFGIVPKRLCIWAKNSANPTPDVAFNKTFEICVYGTIGNPQLNPLYNLTGVLNEDIGVGNEAADQLGNITNLWVSKRLPTSQYSHPTEKNPELHIKPIRRCSKRGDVILDLFGGSGSTMVACEELSRSCYMMEIEPNFCDVIINRYEKLTGNKAVLLET